MSSSISSSERVAAPPAVAEPAGAAPARRRTRGRLMLGAVVAVLGALELTTRLWLVPASRDLSRFAAYPAQARAFLERPGIKVALVGNSATQEGVDPQLLARALTAAVGQPIEVGMFVADSAKMSTDYWIIERELYRQRRRPDLIVVTYFERGLEDGEPVDVGRLARSFTDLGDWRALFAYDLPDLESRADWLVSSFSAAFAARNRIEERVLDGLPGWKEARQRLNRDNLAHESRRAAPDRYLGLERLVERARALGVPLCFVAFPSRSDYAIGDAARAIIAAGGMRLIDLRRVPSLEREHYRDWVHLNERGRSVYTAVLGRALTSLVASAHSGENR